MATGIEGKVAIVTGGAGGEAGLGFTATEALARAGARVAVWDYSAAAIERARAELAAEGLSASFYEVDVTNPEQVGEAYGDIVEALGPVDFLLNNAALKVGYVIGRAGRQFQDVPPLWELDPERFRRLIEVNVVGTFVTMRAVAPDMVARRRGSIVNTSTSPHTQISGRQIPYGPSKSAIESLTRGAAEQLKPHGVRVNAILPGGAVNLRHETKPTLQPWDALAPLTLWLASDRSEAITGQVFSAAEFQPPEPPPAAEQTV